MTGSPVVHVRLQIFLRVSEGMGRIMPKRDFRIDGGSKVPATHAIEQYIGRTARWYSNSFACSMKTSFNLAKVISNT